MAAYFSADVKAKSHENLGHLKVGEKVPFVLGLCEDKKTPLLYIGKIVTPGTSSEGAKRTAMAQGSIERVEGPADFAVSGCNAAHHQQFERALQTVDYVAKVSFV